MAYIIQGMRDLLAKGQDLPTLPTVVFQLHRVLDDERAGSAQVAAIIERDPALTGRLLKAANSAAFSRGTPIGSVQAAIARLGVGQVRAICIVLAVVKAFGSLRGGLDHARFWVHSATVGMMAERLSQLFGRSLTVAADDMYVAGLLHDCGLLVLEQFFPRDFQEVRQLRIETGGQLWMLEEEHLGMDHGAVGGLLLGRWSLPPFIAEAVTNHHRPDQADEEYQEVCRMVYAAEVLCSLGGMELADEGPPGATAAEAVGLLGGSPEMARDLLEEVPALGEKARQFLS